MSATRLDGFVTRSCGIAKHVLAPGESSSGEGGCRYVIEADFSKIDKVIVTAHDISERTKQAQWQIPIDLK